MDTLILFPAEEAPARTAVDLYQALAGPAAGGSGAGGALAQGVTIAAIQTGAKPLPADLADQVERIFTLPDWPFSPERGMHAPDPDDPDHSRLARFLRQGFKRVFVFGWALAPLSALLPRDIARFLVVGDWMLHGELLLSPDLVTTRTGPMLHEAEDITVDYDRVLCTEQSIHAMMKTLFPAKAVAAPVPIQGYPADQSNSWPIRFRAPNQHYDTYTQDGLSSHLARQTARQRRGKSIVPIELPPEYAFIRDLADPTPNPILLECADHHAPTLEISVQLRRTEFRARNAMHAGNLMFLLEARAPDCPEDDYLIAPGGQRMRIEDLLNDQAVWRPFWAQSVTCFRAIQDHNLDFWVRMASGRTPPGGSFLFAPLKPRDEPVSGVASGAASGAASGGGDQAIIRAHAAAPLDSGPGLALVQMLLLQGQPEKALAYLGMLMRAAAIAATTTGSAAAAQIQAPQALLDLMKRQSVFQQPRSRAVLDKLWRDLDRAGVDESGGLYPTFRLSDTGTAPPVHVSRTAPVFELGLQRDNNGDRRFNGIFSLVYAHEAVARDRALFMMISGQLDDSDMEIATAQIEVDGKTSQAKVTQRADGSFFVPVPILLAKEATPNTTGPDTAGAQGPRDLFSVSVSITARGGASSTTAASASGRIDQIDLMRRVELFDNGRIDRLSDVLAVLPTQDHWRLPGFHNIERGEITPPVRWIQDRASLDLVWAAPPPKQISGAVCVVVVLQAARNGPPPEELYLKTPSGDLRALPVPAPVRGARTYVFDVTDLLAERIRLPRLELVSPVPSESVGGDQRPLSVLLRAVSLVQMPLSVLDEQPQVLSMGNGLTTPGGDLDRPARLRKGLRLLLTVPHLQSPSRILEIRGRGDDRVFAMGVRLGRAAVEPVDITLEAGRFVWRGRVVADRPKLAFAAGLQLRIDAELPEDTEPMEITEVSFALPDDGRPGFDLMDGGNFPGTAGYYHSGPAMRGVWSGSGGQLLVDVPTGATEVWLSGDAAIDRAPIEAMTLCCDGEPLDCHATLSPDGHWTVTGQIEPQPQTRIAVIEIGSQTALQGPVGLVRRAGSALPTGRGE